MWNRKQRPVRYYNAYAPEKSRPVTLRHLRPANHASINKPSSVKKFSLIAVILLMLGVVGTVLFKVYFSPDTPQSNSDAKVEVVPKKEYKPINETQLQTDVASVIAENSSLDIGVSIIDIRTNKQYTYGVDVPYIAASVGKILSACLLLHEVESGKYTLEQQIGNESARVQIQKMISKSDNESWRAINNDLGRPALQAYAASVGVQNYDADKNTVTPSSVASLLNKLYAHQLLNHDNTSFLLANMQTDLEEIQFIRKYIDPMTSVYHKAGWLDDRAHDTAIVENGDRPYVLVVFSKKRFGDYDFSVGQKIFEELTTRTNGIFVAAL